MASQRVRQDWGNWTTTSSLHNLICWSPTTPQASFSWETNSQPAGIFFSSNSSMSDGQDSSGPCLSALLWQKQALLVSNHLGDHWALYLSSQVGVFSLQDDSNNPTSSTSNWGSPQSKWPPHRRPPPPVRYLDRLRTCHWVIILLLQEDSKWEQRINLSTLNLTHFNPRGHQYWWSAFKANDLSPFFGCRKGGSWSNFYFYFFDHS